MNPSKNRERVIVFDVNETLLDIEILNPFFESIFGEVRVMRQWFAELILYSPSLTLSGSYSPFGQLGMVVLKMVADIKNISLVENDLDEFKDLLGRLPAHKDVDPALQMLKSSGFRLVTLTNSAPEAGRAVLQKAGLSHYFEKQFSVEAVSRFKPAPETYAGVASALSTDAGSLRLVAAHTWDTLGAMAAGWKTALLTRIGNAPLLIGEQPDIVENDLLAIAHRIVTIDR